MLKALANTRCQNALVSNPQRFLRKATRREINVEFEVERKDYQNKVAAIRKNHKQEFWDMHTQVENFHIDQHKAERVDKMDFDMTKWRTQICNISWMSQKKMKTLAEREEKLLGTMQMKDIKENKRKLLNKYKLDAMQMESQRWPKLKDLDHTITTNYVLPQTVLNYTDYQEKLQKLAFYAEQGDNEGMQRILDKEDTMK
jgi:hypothetical protein